DVVAEVGGVPDHHVLVEDRLAVYPVIERRLVGRAPGDRAVVDLARPVAEDPDVSPGERPVRRGCRYSVAGARDDIVGVARRGVVDPPFAFAGWVPWARDLVHLVVPVRGTEGGKAGVVELSDAVVPRGADVEVEAPVDMVVMDVADAGALDRGEAEARANRPIGGEAPLADVAVPARFHLRDEHHLLPLDVDRNAVEV